MSWPKPKFFRSEVNRAGGILIGGPSKFEELVWALEVLNNWRSCHGYPINTFQATLRKKLVGIDGNAIVAQRLKREASILSKLKRQDSRRCEPMQLSRMQDIGGIRAVVKDIRSVRRLEESYRNSRFRHELVAQGKDYISNPKTSGYRSVHLVYKYKNPRASEYDRLRVELQIRTSVQHAWATAVEIMGTFLQQALKSSEGPKEWLDFFALTGSAFSHLENSPPVPGYEHLSRLQTFESVLNEASRLDVRDRLAAFAIAGDQIWADKRSGSFHLVVLNTSTKTVKVDTFSKTRLEEASDQYQGVERQISKGLPAQAVLVSAGPIKSLRRAYPNFFLDTRQFIRYLDLLKRHVLRADTG